ncbi:MULTISPECIES: hypothetical protein [unclassified Rhodococcus (in: high G+C Gram-positive bacteria)]|uniref:hypothetical protein n=1 Tax=unclassified Rhodococcus (in: high G+C Gram-positive bacteria) TaxID=192944 RepID=UPI000B3D08D8|nr:MULTISPECIES: hypothetical protein [unclassified Rhodococcus (in: high G+C Gram-positive bacteria)]KAF0960945.1 hypothetical protein MLGJGCBP_06064 [Rhodococcus sp. T7]OUS91973.1 hypothetical protein CA951_30500 [Rhodococcus sp. NCIMB 12038]
MVAVQIQVGDLVQASGHAGPWLVIEVSKGMASLQHPDGHRLSVRTTTLSVVHKATSPAGEVQPPARDQPGESPTLFD